MRCLEQTEIVRFLSGSMEQELKAQVERHLASCERCRRAVELVKAAPTQPTDAQPELPEPIKVSCPECRARYLVPARRAQGRLLKIRCKSCQSIIELKGQSQLEPSALDRVRKQWFLVIKRQRIGPLTECEVQERLERGEVKGRSYAWRKGYKGWQRLTSIPEFRLLAQKQQKGKQGAEQPQASASKTGVGEEGHPVSFADATKPLSPGQAQALVAKLAHGEELDEATLERRPQLAPGQEEEEGEVLPGAMFDPEAEEDADLQLQRMKAQRHESSVLFSLGHLKQLSQASSLPEEQPQAGGITGLFDIRPLATPPPPILVPEEQAPPVGFGWQALLAVGLAGLLAGAGMIVGAILFWAPELVDPLLGRLRWSQPPAASSAESAPALPRQERAPAAVPTPAPLLPQASPIVGEDAAKPGEAANAGQQEGDPAAAPLPADEAEPPAPR